MKPLSLLSRYLLVTAVVCIAAVAVTGAGLYVVFRSALEGAVTRSAEVQQQRDLDLALEQASVTTESVAQRLADSTVRS
jgi:hypothetical protein